MEIARPGVSQPLHDFEQHLEVKILFIPDHPDHRIGSVILELPQRGADVLRDVDTGPVTAEHNLAPQFAEVAEHRPVLPPGEDPPSETVGDDILAEQIGFTLQIGVVKMNAHPGVSLRKPLEHPGIHLLPECADFGIARLPVLQHFLRGSAKLRLEKKLFTVLVGQLRMRGLQRRDLPGERLIVIHIEFADQMIPFHPGGLRRAAVPEPLVGDHRLADVDSPVVDQIDLDHLMADPLEQRGQRHAERVVPHVPEVLRLVGVGGGIFDQNPPPLRLREPRGIQQPVHRRNRIPMQRGGLDRHIDERFDHLHRLNVGVSLQKPGDRLRRADRIAAETADPETIQGKIPGHPVRTTFRHQGRRRRISGKLTPEKLLQIRQKNKLHNDFRSFVTRWSAPPYTPLRPAA